MDVSKLKLLQALEECNKHIKRMLYAYHKMATFMPLGEANALNINIVYENTQKLYDIFMQVKMYVNDNLLPLNTIIARFTRLFE